ncbi:hypothetical protein [Rheinheimera sp. MMS21-TC3]|uniref:hypothetical protein n=1 Tax=Rheinheimera sp. MMS21-TC3 TaxID=3072790 RepID=UPI0028C4BE49|nr:hypothetical protein [Rheinheimera sp. MMS21-TC3]WNO60454.1 hypothetical protein RDV63_05670 [Rheinheimera sp. MMS21-TC3]
MKNIPQDMLPGSVHETKNYGRIKVISYENKRKVTVRFACTGYETSAEATHIRSGAVKDWSNVQVGAIYSTNNYGDMEIVEYHNALNVSVRFLNTGNIVKARLCNIIIGCVKDPLARTVCSVGYLGNGYNQNHKGAQTRAIYSRWIDMIKRCYDPKKQERHPTYKGCSVCDEWHNFQNFVKWFEANHPKDGKYYELDKDIIVTGNKVYSPETCVFATRSENTLEMADRNYAKTYIFTNPCGQRVVIRNLRKFCRENNLDQSAMIKVAKHGQAFHKGWRTAA